MTAHTARALILAFAVALAACSPAPAAAPTQPVASATPLPPAATAEPTLVPTATPVTMPFGGGVIVYAFLESRPESTVVSLVSEGEVLIAEIEGDFQPGLVALSPNGAHVVVEVLEDQSGSFYLVDFSISPAKISDLGRLPGWEPAEGIMFSPNGAFIAVVYPFSENPTYVRLFSINPDTKLQGGLRLGEFFLKDIENCGDVMAFSLDSTQLYCKTVSPVFNVPEPFIYSLETGVRKDVLNIPSLKQWREIGELIYPEYLSLKHGQALWANFAEYYLDQNLDEHTAIQTWTSEDISGLWQQPVVAAFPTFPNLQDVIWSPDGSKLLFTGSVATGNGPCLSNGQYTRIASLESAYMPASKDEIVNQLYALDWSPNGEGILALSQEGEICKLVIADAANLEEAFVVHPSFATRKVRSELVGIWHFYESVFAIDALWLP